MAIFAETLAVVVALPAGLAQSTQDLTSPAARDWPTYGRNLQMWRYSPLDQINTDNVGTLRLAWSRGLSTIYEDQGSPLEFGAILYINGPDLVEALVATNGDQVWSTQVGAILYGVGFSAGPIFADGKIIVGPSGPDVGGANGRVIAMDVNSGEILWTFRTVPQLGEPGFDTWQPPSAAHWGGASAWTPGAYDPASKAVIYGVGQPIP